MKSYLDYGAFTPIQVAATCALNGPQDCVADMRALYRERRDVLIRGLAQAGWDMYRAPKAACSPGRRFRHATPISAAWNFPSCCWRARTSPSHPGLGFGEHGDGHVRIGLVENTQRLRQAIRNIRGCSCRPTAIWPPSPQPVLEAAPFEPTAPRENRDRRPRHGPAAGVLRLLRRQRRHWLSARAGRPITVTAVSARDRTREPRLFGSSARCAGTTIRSPLRPIPEIDVVAELIGGAGRPGPLGRVDRPARRPPRGDREQGAAGTARRRTGRGGRGRAARHSPTRRLWRVASR